MAGEEAMTGRRTRMRVLLVDGNETAREALRGVLATHEDVELVGEARDGMAAVALTHQLKPDVVVVEPSLPDVAGASALRAISMASPATRVLAVSSHRDKRYVARMLQSGATGYLVKDFGFEELRDALCAVDQGDAYVSPTISGVECAL